MNDLEVGMFVFGTELGRLAGGKGLCECGRSSDAFGAATRAGEGVSKCDSAIGARINGSK